jgi:alpha-beta hydrolase superfamily lysophospholipase
VLAPGGYDSTAEELYPTVAAGVSRGYAVLAFDGPGQGGTLYEQRVAMRPDWEAVIPPVVDVIAKRSEIDPERIALADGAERASPGPRCIGLSRPLGRVSS